jgi:hypothetical protein
VFPSFRGLSFTPFFTGLILCHFRVTLIYTMWMLFLWISVCILLFQYLITSFNPLEAKINVLLYKNLFRTSQKIVRVHYKNRGLKSKYREIVRFVRNL